MPRRCTERPASNGVGADPARGSDGPALGIGVGMSGADGRGTVCRARLEGSRRDGAFQSANRIGPLLPMLLLLALGGCGSDAGPMSENYGNLLASPEGLVVVESEHPTGWTRPECFACHDINNIHQINRTGLPNDEVDLPGVRAIVRNQGEASCPLCHGDNGVPQ